MICISAAHTKFSDLGDFIRIFFEFLPQNFGGNDSMWQILSQNYRNKNHQLETRADL